MYIAINRFKINQGKKDAFEKMWQRRETHLDNVPGFIKFHLAKGNSEQTHTPYISQSTWHSKEYFTQRTKSEAFRLAHKGAGKHSDIYQGHPIFEGFEVIIGA
jgi:heme-degrading monooxygenase HmoA